MTREEILAVIKANIVSVVEHVDENQIQEDVLLSDLYADSIEIVEVISRSMKQLRLKIPRTSLADAYQIGDLVDIFEQASVSGSVVPPRASARADSGEAVS